MAVSKSFRVILVGFCDKTTGIFRSGGETNLREKGAAIISISLCPCAPMFFFSMVLSQHFATGPEVFQRDSYVWSRSHSGGFSMVNFNGPVLEGYFFTSTRMEMAAILIFQHFVFHLSSLYTRNLIVIQMHNHFMNISCLYFCNMPNLGF